MRFLTLMFAVAGLMIFTAGCKTVREVEVGKEFSVIGEEDEAAMDAAGKQYGEDILKSLSTSDYQLLLSRLTPEFKDQIPEPDFLKQCEDYKTQSGEQLETIFLSSMRRGPKSRIFLWKVEYTKALPQKEGEPQIITYDRLFIIPLVKIEDQYYATGFQFL